MNLFYKNNGTVTVFLTIIMIPVLLFAGLAIDFTRINAASAILADATSLTLNTGLASYDQVLKDVYGLLAMSSTEEELSNNLVAYFDNTINALHLNDEEEDSYTQSIINDIKNMISKPEEFDYNNLVDMTTEKFNAKGVEGTQLYNPEVAKRQVVDYMKYRGPVSIGTNLLEKIDFFTEVPKQQEVIEAKTNYESELSDAQKACEDTYLSIKNYDNAVAQLGNYTVDDFIDEAKNGVGNIWGLYDINKLVVGIYKNTYFDTTYRSYKNIKIDSNLEYIAIKTYLESNASDIKSRVGELISATLSKPDEILSLFYNIADNYNEILTIKEYYENLDSAFSDYASEIEKKFEKEEDERRKQAEQQKIEFVPRENTELEEANREYKRLCKSLKNPMEAVSAYISYMKDKESLISGIINIKAMELDTYLLEKYQLLLNICLSLDDVNQNLYYLSDNIIPNLEKDSQIWKDKIDSLSDGEIKSSMQSQYNDMAKSLRKDDVKLLIEIIENNILFYNYVCTDYENVLYCNISMCGSKTIDNLVKKINSSVMQTDLSTFNDSITKSDVTFAIYFSTPDLSNIKNYNFKKYTDTEFYKFLIRVCKDKVENNTNSNTQSKKAAKEEKGKLMDNISKITDEYKAESEAKTIAMEVPTTGDIYEDLATTINQNSSDESKENIKSQSNINTDNSEDSKKFIENQNSTMKSSMGPIEQLKFYAGNLAEGARDNIYITEYMAEMFSCHTTNKGNNTEKTLTGVELSADNNYLYGSELEYILWGLKGDKTNLNTTCTTASIFGIRFALNTIYAYTDIEIKTWTFSIAVTLAGWTGFGIPLVQNVLIIALALGETAYDLVKLLNGEDVMIYKTSSTWLLKPSALAKELTKGVAKTLTEEALNKLNDKIIEVAENKADAAAGALEESFDEYANKLKDDIASGISSLILMPIQAQIDVIVGGYEYDINKLEETLNDSYAQIRVELQKDENEFNRTIKLFVLDYFVNYELNQIINTIKSEYASLKNDASGFSKAMEVLIKDKISSLINVAKDKMKDKYEDFKNAAKEKLKQVGDNVKEEANDVIDEFFNKVASGGGTVTSGDGLSTNKKLNSFAMMNYKEYIELFLLSGMIFNSDKYIVRMCDLIKLNITCSNNAQNSGFMLKNSYTMLQIDTEVGVKTTFMDNDYIPQPNRQKSYTLKNSGRYGY